jgi:hypothetical protein
MAGSSGVPRRSIAVMSLAGRSLSRMARHVMRRASCPRCPRAAPSSRESGLRADGGGTVAGPRGPVLPSRSRGRPGISGGGVKAGRADRVSKVGQYPVCAKLRAGLDAQLTDQVLTGATECLQRLGLPPRAVKRHHELCVEAFAVEGVGDERLKLGDQLAMVSQPQPRLHELFQGSQPLTV